MLAQELLEAHDSTYRSHIVRRKGAMTNVTKHGTINVQGVAIHYSVDDDDPEENEKRAAVSDALGIILNYFDPNADFSNLHVYLTKARDSAGYIDEGKSGTLKQRLFLGGNIVKYVEKDEDMTKLVKKQDGLTVHGGLGKHPLGMRIVADQVYDLSAQDTAAENRATSAVLHEFGHALHCLRSPDHYYRLADEIPTITNKTASNDVKKFHQKVKTLGRENVSYYAGANPLEFVAEVFSGLMMGLVFDKKITDAYAECGGPLGRGNVVRSGGFLSRKRKLG